MATAKSKLTTVCTETTSGVARPARRREAFSNLCQWRAEPRQPIARAPKITCFHRAVAPSRRVARSGISPTYQKTAEIVKYVETAKTSQSKELRNCGHISIVFGYGNSQ